jgi:MOSC domain-containing protein YiiM
MFTRDGFMLARETAHIGLDVRVIEEGFVREGDSIERLT